MRKEELEVFQTVAEDGTIRMALHEMDVAPKHCHTAKPRAKFPFRVVFLKNNTDQMWKYSCRGDLDSYEPARGAVGSDRTVGTDFAAIEWLLEGE